MQTLTSPYGLFELAEASPFVLFSSPGEALTELQRGTARGKFDWTRPLPDALRAVGLHEEFGDGMGVEAMRKWHQVPWYGLLESYLHPAPGVPQVTDVLINGPGRPISIVQDGNRYNANLTPHPSWIVFLQRQLLMQAGMVSPEAPDVWPSRIKLEHESQVVGTVDRRIRFAITRTPTTPTGPTVALRLLPARWRTLDELVREGIATAGMKELLLHALRNGVSILVAGGTGSGKTTLTAAVLMAIGEEKRVLVIEEAAELPILDDSVHMEVLQSGHTFAECVRFTLRQKPDLIAVGEVRGPEALAMLQAAATGHPGIGTIHAGDTYAALANLERMACEDGGVPADVVRRMIGAKAAPLLVVHIGRYGNQRRIGRIDEVLVQANAQAGAGFSLHPVFVFDEARGAYLFRSVQGDWGKGRTFSN